jgi:hypothetical protein
MRRLNGFRRVFPQRMMRSALAEVVILSLKTLRKGNINHPSLLCSFPRKDDCTYHLMAEDDLLLLLSRGDGDV